MISPRIYIHHSLKTSFLTNLLLAQCLTSRNGGSGSIPGDWDLPITNVGFVDGENTTTY
jgi:hypothetical protein